MSEKKKLDPEAQKHLDECLAKVIASFSEGLAKYQKGIMDGTIEDLHDGAVDPEKLDDHLT